MKYDIDKAIEQVGGQPWELVLTIQGKPWSVRPLQIGDIDRLGQLAGQAKEARDGVVRDLFPGCVAPVEEWDATIVSHIVAAVIGYQRGRVLKNSQAVVTEVATAAMRE